jgi:hypothetical protein
LPDLGIPDKKQKVIAADKGESLNKSNVTPTPKVEDVPPTTESADTHERKQNTVPVDKKQG